MPICNLKQFWCNLYSFSYRQLRDPNEVGFYQNYSHTLCVFPDSVSVLSCGGIILIVEISYKKKPTVKYSLDLSNSDC